MKQKTYNQVTCTIFLIITILHVLRLLFGLNANPALSPAKVLNAVPLKSLFLLGGRQPRCRFADAQRGWATTPNQFFPYSLKLFLTNHCNHRRH